MVESQNKGIGFGTEFIDGLQGWSCEVLTSPQLKVSHLAEEVRAVSGSVDVPNLPLNLCIELLIAPFRPISDFEKSVQEALNDNNAGKEGQPCVSSRTPAICIDCSWLTSCFSINFASLFVLSRRTTEGTRIRSFNKILHFFQHTYGSFDMLFLIHCHCPQSSQMSEVRHITYGSTDERQNVPKSVIFVSQFWHWF
jgi:hypothetical protein